MIISNKVPTIEKSLDNITKKINLKRDYYDNLERVIVKKTIKRRDAIEKKYRDSLLRRKLYYASKIELQSKGGTT